MEVQLSNNEGVAPGLNFSDGKKKKVLSYFKTKKANLAKAQQKIEAGREAKVKEELQAKRVAYENDIIQIILGHLLCMLN